MVSVELRCREAIGQPFPWQQCANELSLAVALAGMQRAVPRSVTAVFRLIETDFLKGPWVLGERFSICDPYLFTLAQWLEADVVDTTVLPRVIEHRARVAERPATQRAVAIELEGVDA